MPLFEKRELALHRGQIISPSAKAAFSRLMRDVLGVESGAQTESWTSFAYFAPDGRCVANVDAAILPLVIDETEVLASGLRSVAVDSDWRGHGLFRDLMNEALAWCAAAGAGLVFLYTEEPALYGRFGFQTLTQHSFQGPAPLPSRGAKTRKLDIRRAADRKTLEDLLPRRGPVSSHCAIRIDPALFVANVAKDDALVLSYSRQLDALIVHEGDDDDVAIVDIVASSIPDLATLLGALGLGPRHIKVLFPTDRLNWQGNAVPEDTGLMVRGLVPAAMRRPFMFPPTAEF